MIEAITTGFLLGCVLTLLIGPVFFMLLNTSIRKGFMPAAHLAFGVFLSDLVFVIIAYLGSNTLAIVQSNQMWVGIIGGGILIVFGIINIAKKPHIPGADLELPDDSKTLWIDTGKGFMMNALNPFVLIFWLGVSSSLTAKQQLSSTYSIVFFGSALITIFATDLLKAFLAIRLKKLIKPSFLLWLNRLSGLGLMTYGVRMIVKLFMID